MVGIAYRALLKDGERPRAGSEMLEVAAFPRDGLPELAFTSHREVLGDWLASGAGSRRR
jgi:hypothetical protein